MLRRCNNALRVLAAMALIGAAAPARAEIALTPREAAIVRLNVLDLLAKEPRLPLPIKQRRDVLEAYYHTGNGALLWLGSKRAGALVKRLLAADKEGLDPKDYDGKALAEVNAESPTLDKRRLAIAELYFSAAFLQYASDLRVGRVLPSQVDPDFFLQRRTIDPLAALRGVAQAPSLEQFFAAWQPHHPLYAALRKALADYRALAAQGGWQSVALGPSLHPGGTDARVPAIRARLAVTDGAGAAPRPPRPPSTTPRWSRRSSASSSARASPSTASSATRPSSP